MRFLLTTILLSSILFFPGCKTVPEEQPTIPISPPQPVEKTEEPVEVEKPQTIVVPVSGVGDISDTRKLILQNTLTDELKEHFRIISQERFEEAQEQAFQELDYEECTEDRCIMLIQEMLQVENVFHLQVIREGNDTQMSLSWRTLDEKKNETDVCRGCGTFDLNDKVKGLVGILLGVMEEVKQVETPKKFEQKVVETPKVVPPKKVEPQDLSDILILPEPESEAKSERLYQTPTETVIDTSTGLMWQKKPDGVERNWEEAIRYCRDLVLGGFSDWRLPSKEVLTDMIEKKQIFDPYKRQADYWSSTTYELSTSNAWRVNFSIGSVGSYNKTFRDSVGIDFYARCVRGGQQEELAVLRPKSESEGSWLDPVTGMKFLLIPGGTFMMGSPPSEQGRDDDETQHTVQVGEFWLAETEVTQAQWKVLMGSNPSRFPFDDNLPMEKVSWNDAQKFIKKLNARAGKKFRLPTEAEWEYAARAGTTTARYWGEEIGNNNANCNGCGSRWDAKQTAPVGSFAPNAFGIYDMLGNVWEWTCSEYKYRYDGSEERCASKADTYSHRGGSWDFQPGRVRAADRLYSRPGGRYTSTGFRLAMEDSERQATELPKPSAKVRITYERDGDIYVADKFSSNARKLIDHPAVDNFPAWSPDGRRIVFSSDRNRQAMPQGWVPHSLYIVDAEGSNLTRLTRPFGGPGGHNFLPSWSPDGSQIAFHRNCTLAVINPDGTNLRTLVENRPTSRVELCVGYPTWSPDGQKLAFVDWKREPCSQESGPYCNHFYVVNADGTGLLRLASISSVLQGRAYVVWSPDGSKVAFMIPQGHGPGLDFPKIYYVMNSDGSGVPVEVESIPDSWHPWYYPQWSD